MGLLSAHLDDAAFRRCLGRDGRRSAARNPVPSAEAHLSACAECRARFAAFNEWLDGLRIDARDRSGRDVPRGAAGRSAGADPPAARSVEHPARVIAFPRFTRPSSVQPTGRRRWVAAAAAAGLVRRRRRSGKCSSSAGSTLRVRPTRCRTSDPSRRPGAAERSHANGGAAGVVTERRRVPRPRVEPELTSSQARVPESLQYLNAITPSARDYDPR